MRTPLSSAEAAEKRAKTVKGDPDSTKAAVIAMIAQEDEQRRAKSEHLRTLRLSRQTKS